MGSVGRVGGSRARCALVRGMTRQLLIIIGDEFKREEGGRANAIIVNLYRKVIGGKEERESRELRAPGKNSFGDVVKISLVQ